MKDRRVDPGFEGVSLLLLSIVHEWHCYIDDIEVAWWIPTDLQGQEILFSSLSFFFFIFLRNQWRVSSERRGVEGLDSLRRYVKPKNASLRREKAGKKGVRLFLGPIRLPDPSFVPFRVEIPFFSLPPSPPSSEEFASLIHWTDKWEQDRFVINRCWLIDPDWDGEEEGSRQ